MRYFRRRWNDSRGDGFDSWGATTYYFEVGKDGWPTRQVESYDTGPILRYGQGRVECDHGRLKARLRPMRGLNTHRTASVVIRGHAFIQNLRRGHYELAVDATRVFRLATAFDELRPAI